MNKEPIDMLEQEPFQLWMVGRSPDGAGVEKVECTFAGLRNAIQTYADCQDFTPEDESQHRPFKAELFVWKGRYADPANDFDIEDFFCNQCEQNKNTPGDEDWITYGISDEQLHTLNQEIQEVIRSHFQEWELHDAYAWIDGPLFCRFIVGLDNVVDFAENFKP